MREKPWYPVVFMFVLTAFFSLILIGLSRFTRDRVEANQKLAVEKAVLLALPMALPVKASSLELHQFFLDRVSEPTPSSGGAYVLMEGDAVSAYALPISGQGFWDRIQGVIGIAADKKTVTGIAFYEQNETPGLGAEIAKPPFRSQFKDKQLAEGPKPLSFKPVGSSLGQNDVHAVTGATQTSTRLEKLVNEDLARWRAAMEKEGESPP